MRVALPLLEALRGLTREMSVSNVLGPLASPLYAWDPASGLELVSHPPCPRPCIGGGWVW